MQNWSGFGGAEAISRRYEFYKYTGSFTVDGDALCVNANCSSPGLKELGAYIGSQISAANLVDFAAATPEPGTLWIAGSAVLIFWRLRRRGTSNSTCPR